MATIAQDEYRTGTLGAANDVVECSLPAFATALVQLTGTFVGTVVFELNNDQGTSPTWEATNALDVSDGAIAASATAPGMFRVDVSGAREFRVRCSAYTSGTVNVDINGTVAPSSQGLVAAITLSGDVTAGTEYTEGDIDATITGGAIMWEDAADTIRAVSAAKPLPTSIINFVPGVDATSLGKAEDASHTSGDVGVMPLAVRQDTAGALATTDGDYIPLTTDNAGSLRTTGDASAAFADVNATLPTAIAKEQRVVADMLVMDAGGNSANRIRSVKDAIAGTSGGGATPSSGIVGYDGTVFRPVTISTTGNALIAGDTAHDGVDAGNPVKIGAVAIAHGTNPTAVAAADRTKTYANRAGIPFSLGGHPNPITRRDNFTAAQTDTALVTVAAGLKIVVLRQMFACDKANSVNVSARSGFGTANTPTGAGVVLSHPGIDPGGGATTGNGGGILGVGADDEDLRFTCSVPTGGSIDVLTTYFTIES